MLAKSFFVASKSGVAGIIFEEKDLKDDSKNSKINIDSGMDVMVYFEHGNRAPRKTRVRQHPGLLGNLNRQASLAGAKVTFVEI